MQSHTPRVAYFPDSFHEVNGVAHTSRHFEAYAERRGLPFLCVRAGKGLAAPGQPSLPSVPSGIQLAAARSPLDTPEEARISSVSTLELPRGFLSFALDKDLSYDPGFLRHLPAMLRAVRAFAPDLIHVTGPSELGVAGALLAHHLHVPLVASWHTNVHEYAAQRSDWLLRLLPVPEKQQAEGAIRNVSLAAVAAFYRQAQLLFAPNAELCQLLVKATGRPCRLMPRGVDAELFSPVHRTGAADLATPDAVAHPVLGFVGRLSIEKNIQLLAQVQERLPALGVSQARFLIVGQGAQEAWLREHLPGAEFPGVLRGAALAEAYARMDCFVFPSHTDTFGNVILEALASGVPAVVTPDGGPAHLVEDRVTGRVVADEEFAPAIAGLLGDGAALAKMRQAARARALGASWDAVFEGVYDGYAEVLADPG